MLNNLTLCRNPAGSKNDNIDIDDHRYWSTKMIHLNSAIKGLASMAARGHHERIFKTWNCWGVRHVLAFFAKSPTELINPGLWVDFCLKLKSCQHCQHSFKLQSSATSASRNGEFSQLWWFLGVACEKKLWWIHYWNYGEFCSWQDLK